MARHYNKARGKKVHKMTRNGIVEQNAVTGEIEIISKREQELNLRTEQPGEQPINFRKSHDSSFNSQTSNSDKPKNEQQRRYKQEAAAEHGIIDTQSNTGATTPSADSNNGSTNGNLITETPAVDNSQLTEPKPEMRIHDKPILIKKTDDLPEKEKYVSLLDSEVYSDDGIHKAKIDDQSKRSETAETPDKKGRLRFSKEETEQGQSDATLELETNTTNQICAPKTALSFEPERISNLQFDRSGRTNTGKIKRKPRNKRQSNNVSQTEQSAQQTGSANATPQQILEPDISGIQSKPDLQTVGQTQYRTQSGVASKLQFTKDVLIEKNSGKKRQKGNKYHQRFVPDEIQPIQTSVTGIEKKPLSDNGKLQFNKESKLSDTPARAKPQKMSRKRKKRMKAEAARAERKIAQTNPELVVMPVTIEKLQSDKTPAISDTQPEKLTSRLKESQSKLQEKPGKLQYDNTGQGKITHAPRQIKKRRLNDSISDNTQPRRENLDTKKTSSDGGRETAKKTAKSSKLQFATDETAPKTDAKLTQLSNVADYYNAKLEKAKSKLPTVKKSKEVRVFDEKKGKAKAKLSFENEILPLGARKQTPAPMELTRKGTEGLRRIGAGKLHHKVYEVEDENVGVQAGHLGERALESGYRGSKRVTRSTFRYFRNKPYRTVEKLEKKALQANIKYSYRKALAENPKLKSSIVSRFMQKRKIKQQYAKAARDAKRAGKAIKKTGDITVKATKAIVGIVKSHPIAAVIVLLVLLLVFFMSSLFSAMSGLAGTGMTAIVASSYLAEDEEIDAAELNYTEWETDLLMQINRAEQDYPGYDEYRYEVDNIGHNPYELMAFLTAKYQVYEYANIQAALQEIFNQQYTLSVTQSVETRYYEGENGELIPYDWNVLTVSLTSRSFTDVIMPLMDTEQTAIYSLLMQTKGNRQYVDSPFDFNWLPNVSSNYGYRIHPITGVKDYHMGVDIAIPVGTDIKAGFDGTVTFAGYSGDYGYVVIIKNDKGVEAKYAHCDLLLVSAGQEIKRGDVIAKSGNSGASTGPHLHMEVVKDGQYLNPLYFSVTNDMGLTTPEYGYAGLPMGDGSYAALIEEAEKHLGKRYVFGSNGPNTFDCSSFVCWTLNQSGVASVGRTTAQGLYNLSTPVSPSDARPGDLIFFHSTYSTTNTVTHVGIYVGSGYMIHAGDPVQYASINSSYFQSHFYAFGRLN